MVSDNKGIHPDSELMVKDWEGTWQEIRETIQRVQERQRKWHDQKSQPAPVYVTLEDVLHGWAKKADRVMLNCTNLRTNISKKTALRPVASCSPRPPDVPGAYNLNSSSGCFRPCSFLPGATFFRPDAPGAPWRSLPSNHTPSAKPLPPAAPEAPIRLPPPPEDFRLRILSSQTRPVPSHDTPLPLNLYQTLPYPPPFPPLSSGRFPTTLPILPVRRTPVAYSPASAGRSPAPLFFALDPPHSSRPPNVIPSARWYTDRLTSFPTL